MYMFTIKLKDSDFTRDQADVLFEAGVGDAGVTCGQAFVGFLKEAASLDEAVGLALNLLHDLHLSPLSIEPENLEAQDEYGKEPASYWQEKLERK